MLGGIHYHSNKNAGQTKSMVEEVSDERKAKGPMTKEPMAVFQTVVQSSLIRHWDFFGAIAAAVFAAIFFAVRMTVQDNIPVVAAFYYASPWAVIFFLATFAGSVFYRYSRKRLAFAFAALAIVSCFGWFFTCFGNQRVREAHGPPHRIVFWNMGYKMFQRPGMADELNRLNADIIAIAEAPGNSRKLRRYAEQQFPDYVCAGRFRGLWLLCKGQILSDSEERLGDTARLKTVHLKLQDQEIRVAILDINSFPLADRRTPMVEIVSRTEQWSDMPTLLVGDFNTPVDSNHVGLLRTKLTHAFKDVGHGYLPTWPAPFPIMQIDHVMGNEKVTFLRASAEWTWRSDHRPLVVEFEVNE
ncbi:MAG: vancomycin resistance protein VanJ [Pirellulaceae bacterium]|jgi:vancomycin resistance protein VanJ